MLAGSNLGKAVQYTLNNKEGLLGYLSDGRVEISNNRIESNICERRAIIDLNRRQKLTHPESRAIIRVEEAFMKGARHDMEWDDTNDT